MTIAERQRNKQSDKQTEKRTWKAVFKPVRVNFVFTHLLYTGSELQQRPNKPQKKIPTTGINSTQLLRSVFYLLFLVADSRLYNPLFGPSVRRLVGRSVGRSFGHKTVFRLFPLLPTRPRLMLPCIQPCLAANILKYLVKREKKRWKKREKRLRENDRQTDRQTDRLGSWVKIQ